VPEIRYYVASDGGTKKRQQRDIEAAAGFWRDYKRTKRSVRKERGER
jgi:hypothetical protein